MEEDKKGIGIGIENEDRNRIGNGRNKMGDENSVNSVMARWWDGEMAGWQMVGWWDGGKKIWPEIRRDSGHYGG